MNGKTIRDMTIDGSVYTFTLENNENKLVVIADVSCSDDQDVRNFSWCLYRVIDGGVIFKHIEGSDIFWYDTYILSEADVSRVNENGIGSIKEILIDVVAFIIVGVAGQINPRVAHGIITKLVAHMRAGELSLDVPMVGYMPNSFPMIVRAIKHVANARENWALAHNTHYKDATIKPVDPKYGSEMLQVFFTDSHGKFPWEDGYDHDVVQTIL